MRTLKPKLMKSIIILEVSLMVIFDGKQWLERPGKGVIDNDNVLTCMIVGYKFFFWKFI